MVNISSFGAELLPCSEFVEAINEVGLELEKWDTESDSNFGVVSISSEDVEDLLLSVSLFFEATER